MSRSARSAGLRYLRNTLASQQYRENSDEQLLHIFATQRDDNAFAALVRRHGPMVLHVCQRVLEHEQDAEDAFQATFLVLAQNAGALRKKSSLASFLHGTAYRLALSAKRAAARRRKYEGQAPARPSIEPADALSWREVRALLDEEIARLPEKYRSAFILCCLEELSRAEAARRMGVNENTLSSRLAEARKRLSQRLVRRGVELTAVLAASTLAAQPASALPPALISTTIQAASATALGHGTAGLVSAHVAGLAKSAASPALLSKIVVFLVLAAGAVAVGAAGRAVFHREPPSPLPEAPHAEAAVKPPAKMPADAVKVSGRVLDPEGKPIEGARLYWPRLPKTEPRSQEEMENLNIAERAKTDADGRFHFDLPRSDIPPEGPSISLVAAAGGYGMDGVNLPKNDPAPEVTLRLVKDHPIEGRILNTEGKPLAGVRAFIWVVGKMRQERFDDFLNAWKQKNALVPDGALGQLSGMMFMPRSLKSAQALTDMDGRFRLQGAGAERLAFVRFLAPGLKPAPLFVVNRPGFDPAAWNKAARDNVLPGNRSPDNPPPLYGPKFEYVTTAGRRIEGTVREAGSGKPVPGYLISTLGDGFKIEAVSDQEGKYKLFGVPKEKEYWLHAHPPENSSWLFTTVIAKDATALQTIQFDITVARGIIVSGRVLDRAAGKGVRADVYYAPLPGNKYFDKPGYEIRQFLRTPTDRREAGRYQLAVMPGPGVLMIQARPFSSTETGGQEVIPYKQTELDAKDREHIKFTKYGAFVTALKDGSFSLSYHNAAKVLDLAPDAGTLKYDPYLERGATRTLHIKDADGKPLTGTIVAGVTATWPDALSIKDATCTIFALDPKKPRRLLFLHPKRNLAGTLMLRGDEREPVVVRLGRADPVIGRLLTSDGQPLAGVEVEVVWSDNPGRALYRVAKQKPTARTDKDGRFRLEGIVPEVTFTLQNVQDFIGEFPIGKRRIKAGETLDLGDVRVKPSR